MNGKEIKIVEIFFEFHIRENDCNVTHVTVTNRTSISKCLMIIIVVIKRARQRE